MMGKILTVIVDDEPIARQGMIRLVENHPDLELAGSYGTAEDAAEYLRTQTADLVLLDIEMPGMSGMRLAEILPEETLIIFTTAYTDYASESYELEATDYLVKPIDSSRFQRAIERAKARIGSRKTATITVKAERKFINIPANEILMIEGIKDYIKIHLEGRHIVTRKTIKGIERLLPSDRFMRIHKSYIVNTSRINSYSNHSVEIAGKEISIGQSYQLITKKRLAEIFGTGS